MTRLRGAQSGFLMQQIGRLFAEGTSIGSTEGELLERFVTGRDESAFEALVARHGPMVLGVCRQLLRDPNDVDDAFQATFLVLVRKAATLRRCDLLGNWLYGVAYRVAVRSRSLSARRTARFGAGAAGESLADSEERRGSAPNPAARMELEPQPWLHHEVSHLPEKYRVPIVLCYFEGLTHDEAAVGWAGRWAPSRGGCPGPATCLRRRLTRRGVDPLRGRARLGAHASPTLKRPFPLLSRWRHQEPPSRSPVTPATSLARASSVAIPVTTLVEGVLQTMIWNQVKLTAASLILAGTVATGVVVGATQLSGGSGDGGNAQAAAESSPASVAQSKRGKDKRAAAQVGGGPALATAKTTAADSTKSISPDLLAQLQETNKSFDNMLSHLRDPGFAEIDRLSTWSNLMLSGRPGPRHQPRRRSRCA